MTGACAEALAKLVARGDLSDLNLNGNALGDDAVLQASPSHRTGHASQRGVGASQLLPYA